MRKLLLLCPLSLLAGCPGVGDRLPDTQNAEVRLKGTTPCITYAVKPGDHISYVQIGSKSGESDSFRKSLNEQAFTPASGKCLPTFGYRFESGKQYVVYYSVDNDNRKRERIIQADFALHADTGFQAEGE
ncbi:hypothetical protein Q5705_04385 [Kosakonia sp. H02]|nr:hypothetical protein Q5705_04385 [Kosakonia sp. H02]